MKPLDDIQEETLRQVKATKHYAKKAAEIVESIEEDKNTKSMETTLSTVLSVITDMNMRQRSIELQIATIRAKVDKMEQEFSKRFT